MNMEMYLNFVAPILIARIFRRTKGFDRMTENIQLKLPKHLPLEYDKYGDLTVKSARDVLNELVELGYGDYELLIGYDSNLAYTGFTDDIEINEKKKKVMVKE